MNYQRDIKNLLHSWKSKKLTIFGKSCIVNTWAISKLIYAGTLLNTPDDEFIRGINRIIFNFIWNKKDRIRRNTLVGDKLKGRINIVEIQSKFKVFKAPWIPKILSCNHELKDFFESFCRRNNFDVNYLLNTIDSFLNEQEMLHYSIPNFYREIMTYFNEYKAKSKTKNIWRDFAFKNKSLCFINLMKSGIPLVKTYSVKVPLKILLNFQILDAKIIGYVNTKYWKTFLWR